MIDPRTLFPLDEELILRSVRKTGRLVVVDEARTTCSAASEIAAIAAEKAFDSSQGAGAARHRPRCGDPLLASAGESGAAR